MGLLVVGVVVSVLAAIAVPNFRSARERSNVRACFANQKTIAGAVERISGPRACACKDALATAIITQAALVPEQTKKDLAPIIGRYMK